jgi:glucose dehydrogenase
MEDQIPLSRNKEILVELLENQDAAYDEKTGKLTWEFDLSSKSNGEKQFSYQVKYPKDYYLRNME